MRGRGEGRGERGEGRGREGGREGGKEGGSEREGERGRGRGREGGKEGERERGRERANPLIYLHVAPPQQNLLDPLGGVSGVRPALLYFLLNSFSREHRRESKLLHLLPQLVCTGLGRRGRMK